MRRGGLRVTQIFAVGRARVWLPCAFPWAGAIRREYATTLGELLMHCHGLVGDLFNQLLVVKGEIRRTKSST